MSAAPINRTVAYEQINPAGIPGPAGPRGLTGATGEAGPSGEEGKTLLTAVACDASVALGDIVRISGSDMVQAQANSATNSDWVGLVEAKGSSTECDVRIIGLSEAVFSGLTPDANYFLDYANPGKITTLIPTTPGHVVTPIGKAYNTTQLLITRGQRMVRA